MYLDVCRMAPYRDSCCDRRAILSVNHCHDYPQALQVWQWHGVAPKHDEENSSERLTFLILDELKMADGGESLTKL